MERNFLFFFNSVLLGVGLAMDAFSVSLANGLNEPRMSRRRMLGIAGVFVAFQALMPMTGWICVASSASRRVMGGRMDGRRRASILLPEPGGSW